MERSVARWNSLCEHGCDDDFGRPSGSMMPIAVPPFYGAPVWATLSNTQGGPVHDAQQRIIDVYGKPIPRLYAAGELGSALGHLYLSAAILPSASSPAVLPDAMLPKHNPGPNSCSCCVRLPKGDVDRLRIWKKFRA